MPRIAALAAATALLFAVACEKHATVLPTEPGGPAGGPTLIITIATDRVSLDAGSSQPATLTVSARYQDGTPAEESTDITINTSLGQFGLDSTGKPLKIVTAKLVKGVATVPFYAGSEVGTANLLASIGLNVGRLNIAIVPAPAAPVADFNFEAAGLSVLFTDASTGSPTNRLWEFGDGTQSSEVNPKHDYAAAGTYTVKLTVSNGGGSNTKSKFVPVSSGPPLVASFKAEASGLTVLFTDTSTGGAVGWQWDFGDGRPYDTTQNPRHVYDRAGTYTVRLTVRNAAGTTASASAFVTVGGTPPQAEFTTQIDRLRVIFTDASTGGPTTWTWNFGDGSPQETNQNVSHTYASPGTYNVTLTAGNIAGTTSKSHFVTVSLGDPPKAAFEAAVSGLKAVFTDKSTGSPTAWDWDFGDATPHGVVQNPTHTYTAAGTYTVTLRVTNAAGDSSISQFVTVTAPPVADFTATVATSNSLAVNFLDQSKGSPTGWLWNFGDCAQQPVCTSTAQNPSHIYPAPGIYTVTLTASNAAGSSQKQREVAAGAPQASFTFTKTGNAVTFSSTSTGNPTFYSWNFGDCPAANCTSATNPVTHTYALAGSYVVTLTVGNAAGQSTTQQQVTVP